MPGSRGGTQHQPNVTDVLSEMLQLIQQAKLLPDAPANMQILQALEQGIIQYIQVMRQQKAAQAVGQQGQGQPGQPPQGQPGMGGGGPMGGSPVGSPGQPIGPRQIAPGGGPGMSGFSTPNPDELRRVLAGPAATGNGS